MKKNKISGFTLAEVLITLTIIGVVAAMTIPTLMSKYQEKAMESQFKKAYSMINQATSLMPDYECYTDVLTQTRTNKDCTIYWKELLNNLKYSKKLENTKLELYKGVSEVVDEGGYAREACEVDTEEDVWDKYYLADGSTIFVINHGHYEVHIILDVNGDKGPNKWGYDAFFLDTIKTANGDIKFQDRVCPMWEKGGKRPVNILTGKKEVTIDSAVWNWNQ